MGQAAELCRRMGTVAGVRLRVWLLAACLTAGLVAVSAGSAQAVTFASGTLPFSGLDDPQGVAVDAAGDVFVLDYYNGGRVVELPADGGAPQTLPFSGLNGPQNVAVDAAGDVFVADTGNDRVLELPAGATMSSQVKTLPFSGLNQPQGVAVDAAGDVFVLNGNSAVLELPAGDTMSSQVKTLPFSGQYIVNSVAVDAAGDVFVGNADDVLELPAGATLASQVITLPFTGGDAYGVAVDPEGDVFVTDFLNNLLVELPAGGGTQQTLPVTGLDGPDGVAVDSSGDLFVANDDSNNVIEVSPDVPSGGLAISPGSGPAGTQIGVDSVLSCPLGATSPTGFGSSKAKVTLRSPSGAELAASGVTLDAGGDWTAELTVPAGSANGAYQVGARCVDAEGVTTQTYAYATFVVAPAVDTTGPQGPQGPAGTNGTNGTNGLNGTNGTNGTNGLNGTNGASPTGSSSKCTSKTKKGTTTTTCKVTYTYSTSKKSSLVNGERAQATAKIDGKRTVVARGEIRDHKLVLTFVHLRRGRYDLTLYEFGAHSHRQTIGHTSLVIS
jgi:streptogramin lyase